MASRFWVGGTGTWDASTTTHWASGSGLAGGASAPTTGDAITFDSASGTGTVTVDATVSGKSFASITADTMTNLTLDFSVSNPTLTLTNIFSSSGTTTRAINLGTSNITLSGGNGIVWNTSTITGLTATFQNATLNFVQSSYAGNATINPGALTFGTVNIGSNFASSYTISTGATWTTLNLTGPLVLTLNANQTITNAVNWAGTSAAPIIISGPNASTASITFSAAGNVASWTGFRAITAVTNTITATNSFDMKNNTNLTITNPSVGGGSHMIGG